MGLRPDGDAVLVRDEGDESGSTSSEGYDLSLDYTLRRALRTRAFWLIGIALAVAMFAQGSINFHQIPYLEDQGLSRTQAALVVLCTAANALDDGALSARYGRWDLTSGQR